MAQYVQVCPQCGSEMWDNRNRKTNPKAPDFKCKNPQCNHAIWPSKNSRPQGQTIPPPQQAARAVPPQDKERELSIGWHLCFKEAIKKRDMGNLEYDQYAQDVAALASALYFQCVRRPKITNDRMAQREQYQPQEPPPPDEVERYPERDLNDPNY